MPKPLKRKQRNKRRRKQQRRERRQREQALQGVEMGNEGIGNSDPVLQLADYVPDESEMDPSLMPEWRKGRDHVEQYLYKDKQAQQRILEALDPEASSDTDGKEPPRVSRAVVMSVSLIAGADKKLDLNPDVIGPLIPSTVGKVMELAQERYQFRYEPEEVKMVLATTVEQVGRIYGMRAEDAKKLSDGFSQSEMEQGMSEFQGMVDAPSRQGGEPVPQGGQPMPQGGQPMPQGGQPMPQGGQPMPQGGQPMPQGLLRG